MKNIIFISILSVSVWVTDSCAQELSGPENKTRRPLNDSIHPMFQTYLGFNSPLLKTSNFIGLQAGIKWYIPRSPFYVGFENTYSYHNNQYTWPGIGNYSYIRQFNCINTMVGFDVLSQRKLSAGFDLRLYYISFEAKLKTENEQLKGYLWDRYRGSFYSVAGSIHVSYKLSKRLSCYVNAGFFQTYKDIFHIPFGAGLAYNIIGAKKIYNGDPFN